MKILSLREGLILFKTNKRLFIILFIVLMSIVITPVCYGNSAEPPSILIIVPGAPDGLELNIGSGDKYSKARETYKAFENYYTFYSHDLGNTDDYTLKVTTRDSTFEILLDKPLKSYNTIFTLDLKNQTLTPGKSSLRSITLVSLRIILTLLIEAIVFLLFGYRWKRSWIAFLIINLLTQGGLNIWINGFAPLSGYIILTMIFGEILVFIAELIAFLIFIKEHRNLRTALYVLTANLLSLIAGGYIITVLPI